MSKDSNLPRRCNLQENSPAEIAIRKAMEEVEKLPANEKLTDAIIILNEAFNLVADYVDIEIEKKESQTLKPDYLHRNCKS